MTSQQLAAMAGKKKASRVDAICRHIFSHSPDDLDLAVVKSNLLKMSYTTVEYVHHAVMHSSQEKFVDSLMALARMDAEEPLKLKSAFWEVSEIPMSLSVNKHMVLKYVNPPLDQNPTLDELAPYVAKAHALCAMANTFWMVTGNVNRVRDIEECYPEYVELFMAHPARALELARLMAYSKATKIGDLKYHLELHPAITGGAL